jgi:hypothetical protein
LIGVVSFRSADLVMLFEPKSPKFDIPLPL